MGDTDTDYDVLEAIPTMIHKLTTLWPCATGNGWDLPKVHAQFHVPYNIACMGNQMNVHSGPHMRPTTLKYKSVRPKMHKDVLKL